MFPITPWTFVVRTMSFPILPGNSYHGTPPYHGSLYIDPTTGAILRVTFEAELKPPSPLIRSAASIEYGNVDIGGKSYICPVESVAISSSRIYLAKEKRDTTILRINEVVFADYHRFGSDSINARSRERATDTCAFLLTLTYIDVANPDLTRNGAPSSLRKQVVVDTCASARTRT